MKNPNTNATTVERKPSDLTKEELLSAVDSVTPLFETLTIADNPLMTYTGLALAGGLADRLYRKSGFGGAVTGPAEQVLKVVSSFPPVIGLLSVLSILGYLGVKLAEQQDEIDILKRAYMGNERTQAMIDSILTASRHEEEELSEPTTP